MLLVSATAVAIRRLSRLGPARHAMADTPARPPRGGVTTTDISLNTRPHNRDLTVTIIP